MRNVLKATGQPELSMTTDYPGRTTRLIQKTRDTIRSSIKMTGRAAIVFAAVSPSMSVHWPKQHTGNARVEMQEQMPMRAWLIKNMLEDMSLSEVITIFSTDIDYFRTTYPQNYRYCYGLAAYLGNSEEELDVAFKEFEDHVYALVDQQDTATQTLCYQLLGLYLTQEVCHQKLGEVCLENERNKESGEAEPESFQDIYDEYCATRKHYDRENAIATNASQQTIHAGNVLGEID